VLFVLGTALSPLLTPAFTRVVAGAFDPQEHTGLSRERSLEIAEQVRRFVARSGSDTLPQTVDGRDGFDESSVSHLADVRSVIAGARVATGVAAGVLASAIVLALSWRRWRVLGAGLRCGSYAIAASVGLLGVMGLVDFEGLFARFHGVFFESGTWTFSSDSLLIQLFPEPFWIVSAVGWTVLTAGGAVSLWWLGGYASTHEGSHEGTRA
jgi:integral membrane protein (TIGR01906 family)